MVVVLKQFSHQKDIKWQGIARVVTVVEVLVAVLVSAPIHNSAVQWAHQKVQWKQQVHPPGGSEKDVEGRVAKAPEDAGRPGAAKFIQPVPRRVIAQKFRGYFRCIAHQAIKNSSGV